MSLERSDYCSDCESGTSIDDKKEQETHFPCTSFIKIQPDEAVHNLIREKFVSQLSSCGYDARVEALYRNNFSTSMSEARRQSFLIHSKALESKTRCSANEVYAWYGGSKAEIHAILDHGFCFPSKNLIYGNGIHLSPAAKPLNSLLSATPETDGLRYMLLCRVILGKSEIICPGSTQCNPSLSEFESGIDSLSSPEMYIIWSSRMNTHILPELVVMFKATRSGYKKRRKEGSSEWMPFTALVRALSRFLRRDAIELIAKVHCDYKKKKMSKVEMIEKLRDIAGDRLLMEIIKSYSGKSTFLRCLNT